jgi:hypothetical protein
MGHFKAKCPKNNGGQKQKEIAMTVTEVMMAEPTTNSWWIDSAATRHITRCREFFVDFKDKAVGEHKVYMGNNTYSDVLGEGKCKISVNGSVIVLYDVLYVPSIRRNLISVPVLDSKGYGIKFKSGKVYIRKGNVSVKGVKVDNMYLLKVDNKISISDYLNVSINSSYLWHLRLGHINKNKMIRMSKSGLLPKINSEDFNICESCIKGKMTNKSFSKHWKSSDLLEVIHSDICGPLRTKTHRGMKYFITFTDDYSRYGHIYLIRHKSEAIEKFKEYKLEVENKLGRSIKNLNNDRGGEYEAMDSFCKASGIRHLYTMPYKPQQNGISERRNRTLMDMTRSMMAYADLPIHFWGEALSTAAYILNRVKTKSKLLTPYEYWTGLKPDIDNLKVWGCKAHVLIPKPLRDKLCSKTWECRFIGYVENGSGYRFYHSEKGLIESRDAVFLENTNQINPMDEIRLLQGDNPACQKSKTFH